MMSILLVLNISFLLALIIADYKVWGLSGGYGKGIWGGNYMMEAIDNKRSAWVGFILCSTLSFTLLYNVGWS